MNGTPVANCPANCTTVQIIEPNNDQIVDTAGTSTDLDESGFVALSAGQTSVGVAFQVAKLNADYHFEYLYIEADGQINPGSITIVPTTRTIGGFVAVFAGTPIQAGYVLYWRVVIRIPTIIQQIDAPENLYLPMPRTNTMQVTFVNMRSGINYGFTELRVENLTDPPAVQAIIRVQVVQKTTTGFLLAVNPTPPNGNYFLAVRTP